MVETLHERVLSILDNIKPVLWHKNPDTSYDSQYPYLSQQRKELLTVVHTFLTALHRPHIRSHGKAEEPCYRQQLLCWTRNKGSSN